MISLPIVETVVAFVLWVLTHLGLPGLLLLMTVESFGLPPMPAEVILPFSGVLIATGVFPWGPALLVALVGGTLGSYLAYLVGRYARPWLLKGPPPLRLEPAQLDRMDAWFQRHGEGWVLIGRLLPVVRSYVSYPAGTAKMDPVRFGVYSVVGAFPFTVALLYIGFVLGQNWASILPIFHLLDYVALAVIGVLAIYGLLRWQGRVGPGWPPRWVPRATPAPSNTDGR